MRNDVKLGLAVGGLLLGVVLAYALFFSNTSKDRNVADGGYSALNSGDASNAAKPAPTDHAQSDPTPPTNNTVPPANSDHAGNSLVDNTAPSNQLIGKSWQLLLNEGASANSTGTISNGADHSSPPSIRNSNPPTETIARETPTRETPIHVDPPASSGPRRYTIKNGDTFWVIAKAEYGNGAYFPHIQRANPGVDPGRIKVGDSIILPDKSEVVATSTAAATARQPSAAELVNLDATKQYRVQKGDNLHVISKKLYGRFDKWSQIYELNKELIGPNPAALKLDMILALPEPPIRIATTIQ